MEETMTETKGPSTTTPELVRPLQGRMVAGVAAGLARRFDTPVWVPRVFFALTAFIGGIGIALYVAGWVLVRSEDEPEPVAARFFANPRNPGAWIGIGLVVLAGVILLDNLTFIDSGVIWSGILLITGVMLYLGYVSLPGGNATPAGGDTGDTGSAPVSSAAVSGQDAAPPSTSTPTPTPTPPMLPPKAPVERSILGRLTLGVAMLGVGILALLDQIPGVAIAAEPRHYLALAVTIIGLGLLVGTIWGRARWLILIAVFLIPGLFLTSLVEMDWDIERWEVAHAPMTFAQLDRTYTADAADMVVDLTGLPWDGEEVELTIRVDVGRVEVVVPEDVAVIGNASVDVGSVRGFGRESGGIGSPGLSFDEPGETGLLDLEVTLDVGSIEVVRGEGS
jgi:phage shock protein PspC (stress-responsive transcriptional regulator)